VLTTPHMAEAEALADHVVVVDGGRAVASGTTGSLLGDEASVRLTVAAPRADAAPTDDDLARDLAGTLRLATVRTTATPGVLEVRGGSQAVDPALLHAITGWALDRGLLLTSVSTGRRTLEDVFLDLTGRTLR